MNKKIKTLIIASILVLIFFGLIQAYLINNTYQIKKDGFINETRKSISRMDDYSPVLDSVNDVWQDYFITLLESYNDNVGRVDTLSFGDKKLKQEELISKLLLKTDSINEGYKQLYSRELAKKNLDLDLKFQKRVKRIIIKDSLYEDTIFDDTGEEMFHLIGDEFSLEEGHKVSSSLWITQNDYVVGEGENKEGRHFDIEFVTQDYMNIDGWKKIVILRMIGVFVMAFLLLLFVFGLLYYSIKNLIKQKKITDVKTDFINNITHELKTPLATMGLATKMLRKEEVLENSAMIHSTIGTIERQNKRLQKLIDQVMDNSMGYQEIELKKEPVLIEEFLNSILDDFLLSVKEKDVVLTRKIKIVSQNISLDKFYITTAVLNLLENAVKYNEKEHILIDFEAKILDGNQLQIIVNDNGIGISAEEQKNLFEKFYRVDNKDIHNVKGLGLGLYYTNQIIKAHHGVLKVKSKQGKGATFTFEIPVNKNLKTNMEE